MKQEQLWSACPPCSSQKRQDCLCAQPASQGSLPFENAEAQLWYGEWAGRAPLTLPGDRAQRTTCAHAAVRPRPKQTATPASYSSQPGQLHRVPCEQGSELLIRSCLTLWEGFLAEAQPCGVAGVSDPGRCLHSTL